jgi:hypothetical protein
MDFDGILYGELKYKFKRLFYYYCFNGVPVTEGHFTTVLVDGRDLQRHKLGF